MAEVSKYSEWTVSKLKVELANRGAVLTGRKESFIERLEAYDRNKDFRCDSVVILPEICIPCWPTTGFKQLVNEHKVILPKINLAQIEGYFKYRVASDNHMTQDCKAIVKGKQLVESSTISACSIHITKTDVNFTGIVEAAMKKKVSYTYKIQVNSQNAKVINPTFECPVGKGPHGTCKHIAAVLLMVAEFIENGQIRVKKSCTDNLQTYHAPKRGHGGK